MSPSETENSSKPRRSRVQATLLALLRTRVTTGVLTILPIAVTLWVIVKIFGLMRWASQWVIELILHHPAAHKVLERWGTTDKLARVETFREEFGFWPPDVDIISLLPPVAQWGVGIFSVLLTIFALYVIGLFSANIFGRRFIQIIERVVDRVPMIKTIYRLPKQIIESFSGQQTKSFQRAALIPFPQEKMRSVGFITNIFKDSVTGEELCAVFIATTPNPTTGYLQVLKRKEITELNWSVEEAIRCVMSGGILKPEFLTIIPNKDLPPNVLRDIRMEAPTIEPTDGQSDPPPPP